MSSNRDLTEEELDWLEDSPIGESHSVEGSSNLAACESCDWVAQGDSFDYLMEQVTNHLEETFAYYDENRLAYRRRSFTDVFGWDPWEERVIGEEEVESHLFDTVVMGYVDEDGNPGEEWFVQEMDGSDNPGGIDEIDEEI